MLRVGQGAWLACLLLAIWSCGGDDGGSTSSAGSGGSATTNEADFCDALAVLEARCQRCHQDPPLNNAPFPLLTYSDTQVERSSGELVYERMIDVLEAGIMPPTAGSYDPPVEPLSCSQKTTLLDWLNAGAPRPAGADPSCVDVEPRLLECAN